MFMWWKSSCEDYEELQATTQSLLGNRSNQDRELVANYADKTMRYFSRRGSSDDQQHHERRGRYGKHAGRHHSNTCVFCREELERNLLVGGYKNNKNAVYCFNCNGIIGKRDILG